MFSPETPFLPKKESKPQKRSIHTTAPTGLASPVDKQLIALAANSIQSSVRIGQHIYVNIYLQSGHETLIK